MRLLVLDHKMDKDSWGSQDLVRALFQAGAKRGLSAALEITVRRPEQGDYPLDGSKFDALVLSGSRTSCSDSSPWVMRLLQFVSTWIESDRPVLGVCYGHQVLARVLGDDSCVGKSEDAEYGWVKLEKIAGSRLLESLPQTFHSYSSHREEVKKLPKGFISTLQSKSCAIQAMEHPTEPLFGIQFHPEKNLVEGDQSLRAVKLYPRINQGKGKSLFDASVGDLVFGNFLTISANRVATT